MILTDNDPAFCIKQVKQFFQEWGGSDCSCDGHTYHRAMALQREAITALRKLQPGNSALFQRPHSGIISCPRTLCPRQSHLQMPFTGTEFQERRSILYKHLTTRKGADHMLWVIPSGLKPWCTTKFKLRQVIGVVSHHSVKVNGVQCHINDYILFSG